MSLKTEWLLLRNYKTEDWERVHIYGSKPDFLNYELWGPNSMEGTHKFVDEVVQQTEANPRYKFDIAVFLKENKLLIGGCSIRRETELNHE